MCQLQLLANVRVVCLSFSAVPQSSLVATVIASCTTDISCKHATWGLTCATSNQALMQLSLRMNVA